MSEQHPSAPAIASRRAQVVAVLGAALVIALIVALTQWVGASRTEDQAAPSGGSSEGTGGGVLGGEAAVPDPPAAADASGAEEATDRALDERPPVPEGAEELRDAAEKLVGQEVSFNLTTFNVLGSNHTRPGGSNPGYAPGRLRTEWIVSLLAGYGSDIVGFQELQTDQLAVLQGGLSDRYAFYTPPGSGAAQTTLVWRKDVWAHEWLSALSMPFSGQVRTRPMVRLRHIESGRRIYVLNIHNTSGGSTTAQRERDQALSIQINAVNELRAEDGLPVLLIGDFNERQTMCSRLTGATGMIASRPGGCGGGAARVDWIFATSETGLAAHREDRSPAVARITDHAVITSTVTLR